MNLNKETRKNRIQGLIVENDKFLLIKHLVVKEGRSFWALPGGGREINETEEQALSREIREETGLTINLAPRRFLSTEIHPGSIYTNMITYLGYPLGGKLNLGEEPEFKNIYKLIEIKWFNLNSLENIDTLTSKYILPVRDYLYSEEFQKIHRVLLITGDNCILLKFNNENHKLVLPDREILTLDVSVKKKLIHWGWTLKVIDNLKFKIHYQHLTLNRDDFVKKLTTRIKFLKFINIEDIDRSLLEAESKRFIDLFFYIN